VGDIIIIASYGVFDEEELKDLKPVLVYVDEHNRIIEVRREMLEEFV